MQPITGGTGTPHRLQNDGPTEPDPIVGRLQRDIRKLKEDIHNKQQWLTRHRDHGGRQRQQLEPKKQLLRKKENELAKREEQLALGKAKYVAAARREDAANAWEPGGLTGHIVGVMQAVVQPLLTLSDAAVGFAHRHPLAAGAVIAAIIIHGARASDTEQGGDAASSSNSNSTGNSSSTTTTTTTTPKTTPLTEKDLKDRFVCSGSSYSDYKTINGTMPVKQPVSLADAKTHCDALFTPPPPTECNTAAQEHCGGWLASVNITKNCQQLKTYATSMQGKLGSSIGDRFKDLDCNKEAGQTSGIDWKSLGIGAAIGAAGAAAVGGAAAGMAAAARGGRGGAGGINFGQRGRDGVELQRQMLQEYQREDEDGLQRALLLSEQDAAGAAAAAAAAAAVAAASAAAGDDDGGLQLMLLESARQYKVEYKKTHGHSPPPSPGAQPRGSQRGSQSQLNFGHSSGGEQDSSV